MKTKTIGGPGFKGTKVPTEDEREQERERLKRRAADEDEFAEAAARWYWRGWQANAFHHPRRK
jgi:hypothetical protein